MRNRSDYSEDQGAKNPPLCGMCENRWELHVSEDPAYPSPIARPCPRCNPVASARLQRDYAAAAGDENWKMIWAAGDERKRKYDSGLDWREP